MTALLIGTALFGLILGRFFKVYVLVPTSAFVLLLTLAAPTLRNYSVTYSCAEIALILACLQAGYFVALASRSFTSSRLGRGGILETPTSSVSSRTLRLP